MITIIKLNTPLHLTRLRYVLVHVFYILYIYYFYFKVFMEPVFKEFLLKALNCSISSYSLLIGLVIYRTVSNNFITRRK